MITRISRRAFLRRVTQFGALLLWDRSDVGRVAATQSGEQQAPSGEGTHGQGAYGQGAYGQGRYPGFRLHLPFITKEHPSHGSSTHPQQ